ncbi:hypothetical protein JCM11641_002138 [Rhodosporidiobolus odoratus]
MSREPPDFPPDPPESSSASQPHFAFNPISSRLPAPNSTMELTRGFSYAKPPNPRGLSGQTKGRVAEVGASRNTASGELGGLGGVGPSDGPKNDFDTEDGEGDVVLAGPSSSTALPPPPKFSLPGLSLPLPSASLDDFRLNPSGEGSPPRRPIASTSRASGQSQSAGTAPQSRSQSGRGRFVPFVSSTGSPLTLDDSSSVSTSARPTDYQGPTRQAPVQPAQTASTSTSQASQLQSRSQLQPQKPFGGAAGGATSQPRMQLPPDTKKRHRSNDSADSAAAVSGNADDVAGASRSTSTGSVGEARRRTSAPTGAQPAGGDKRRKYDSGIGLGGTEDFVQLAHKIMSEQKAKDVELRNLREKLAEKTKEAAKLASDKVLLKTDIATKCKKAIEAASGTNDVLKTVVSEMRTATSTLESEVAAEGTADGIRQDIDELKRVFSNTFLGDDNELLLERNEQTRLVVLKGLAEELDKLQEVITLLRTQLETKAGELAEANDRFSDLSRRFSNLEYSNASLKSDLDHSRRQALDEKTALIDQLHSALIAGSEREELHQKKVDDLAGSWNKKVEDGAEREALLREKWVEAKEETGAKNTEMRLAQEDAAFSEKRAKEREAGLGRLLNEREEIIRETRQNLQRSEREGREKVEEVEHRAGERELNLNFDLQQALLTCKTKVREYKDLEQRFATLQKNQQDSTRTIEDLTLELRQTKTELTEARETSLSETLANLDCTRCETAELREAHARDQQSLEESNMQLQESQAKLIGNEAALREQELRMQRELADANSFLAHLREQQQRSPTPSAEAVAQAEEVVRLRAEAVDLKGRLENMHRRRDEAHSARTEAEETIRSLTEQHQRDLDERTQTATLASLLERDLSSAESTLAEKTAAVQTLQEELEAARAAKRAFNQTLSELETKYAEEKKLAVSNALASSRDTSAREAVQKSNELKRSKNQLEETNKRLIRVSNELAKLKSGHRVIDPHIASSDSGSLPSGSGENGSKASTFVHFSLGRGILTIPFSQSLTTATNGAAAGGGALPKAAAAEKEPSQSSSELTAVEDLGSDPATTAHKSPAKSVKFVSWPETPEKVRVRRRASAGTTPSAVEKKPEGSRKRRASEVEESLQGREQEEEQEEDEIVNSHTPMTSAAQKPRPIPKTYSSKKKR